MRSENIESARALYKILQMAMDNPQGAPKWLANACATQNALAQAEDISKKIAKMSLNSLKSAAQTAIEIGGWKELNRIRVEYLKYIAQQSRIQREAPSQRSKNALAETLKQEIDRRDVEHRARLRLGSAYLDLLRVAQTMAKGNETNMQRLERHQALFGSNLGLQPVPGANE